MSASHYPRTERQLRFETRADRDAATKRAHDALEAQVRATPFVLPPVDRAAAIALLEAGEFGYRVEAGAIFVDSLAAYTHVRNTSVMTRHVLEWYAAKTGAEVDDLRELLPHAFAVVEHVRPSTVGGHHDLLIEGELVARDGELVLVAEAA